MGLRSDLSFLFFPAIYSGDWYGFHGQCDLVLVDAPLALEGQGIFIHARTTARYDYSYIER